MLYLNMLTIKLDIQKPSVIEGDIMILLSFVGILVIFYLWFLSAMWYLRRKNRLKEYYGIGYYLIGVSLIPGFILDVCFNWSFAILIFMDITKDLTLSLRLKHYRNDSKYAGTWRERWATWICEHLLNPHDPTHHHC